MLVLKTKLEKNIEINSFHNRILHLNLRRINDLCIRDCLAMENHFPNKCRLNVAVTRKKQGRSENRYLCVVKEDMQAVVVREVFDLNIWRCDSLCHGETYDQPEHTINILRWCH